MGQAQNSQETLLEDARCALLEDRLDDAARQFGEICAQDPRSPWGYLGVGDVERRRQQYDAALNNYIHAKQFSPKSVVIHLRVGNTLLSLQRYDEAIRYFTYVLDKKPGYEAAILGLAKAASRSTDLAEAVEAYDRLAVEQRDELGHKLKAAGLLQKLGRFDEAVLRYRAISEVSPECFEAHAGSGDVVQAVGDYVTALSHYQRALEIRPHDVKLLLKTASVLLSAGRFEAAQSALTKVISKDATNSVALQLQTRLLDSNVSVESKRASLRQAAEAQHKKSTDWARLARFSADHDGIEAGLAVLDEAEARLERDPKLLVTRAEIYFRRGFDDAAATVLATAHGLFPESLEIVAKLVEQDILKGRFADAAVRLALYPEKNRSQRLKRLMLTATLDEHLWRLDEAAASYTEATRLVPSHVQAHRGLARIEVLRMRPLDAKKSLQTACGLNRGTLLLAGKSTNASQSLVGEFVNDLRSDPHSLELARTAYERRDIAAALRLVREAPDFTGAAMTLFMLLRRCSLLNTTWPSVENRTIPRRIVQFWDSETPPDDVMELMGSWGEHNPTWLYQRYSNETAGKYIASLPDLLVYRAWRSARRVAQRADLFRLALLAHEGGVYVDADDRCTGSLDAVTERPSLLLWHEQFGSTGNNFIAVAPGHPVILMALSKAAGAILRGDGESIWFSTGPGLLTRCAASYFAASAEPLSLLNGELRILDRHELKTICSPGCKTSYKTTGRHWMKAEFSQMANGQA